MYIDPLHVTSHSRHFYMYILPFGGRHFVGQKCIAVIESKLLIVVLLANLSDYSNKTCIFCKTKAHIPVYVSFVRVVTCVGKGQYD